jgi:hypothetical protein
VRELRQSLLDVRREQLPSVLRAQSYTVQCGLKRTYTHVSRHHVSEQRPWRGASLSEHNCFLTQHKPQNAYTCAVMKADVTCVMSTQSTKNGEHACMYTTRATTDGGAKNERWESESTRKVSAAIHVCARDRALVTNIGGRAWTRTCRKAKSLDSDSLSMCGMAVGTKGCALVPPISKRSSSMFMPRRCVCMRMYMS